MGVVLNLKRKKKMKKELGIINCIYVCVVCWEGLDDNLKYYLLEFFYFCFGYISKWDFYL